MEKDIPTETTLSVEEVAKRGEAWYKKLKPQVELDNFGRYLIVDIESGNYEIGDDYIQPTEYLLKQKTRSTIVRSSR